MNTSPPLHPRTKRELIESIYRIALEPQSYDSFMGHWDSFILDQVSQLNSLQETAAALGEEAIDAGEIATHFTLAMQLVEKAGRPDPEQVAAARRPQLMFSGDGTLVWCNAAAGATFGARTGMTLDDFALSSAHRAEVDALIAGTREGVVLTQIAPPGGARALAMSFRRTTQSGNERLIMASEVRQTWPEATDGLLEKGFGLSQSEIAICGLIVEGHSAKQIAALRGAALGTVRTQIKRILQKTDCTAQVELVSLLHATMRLAEGETDDLLPQAKRPDKVIPVALDGRMMPVETFGDPDGTPVIFFHAMLDGNTMTPRLRRLLEDRGFRLHCPVRPHFGAAPPDESGPIATAPQRLARDIERMMAQTGIERPILLGHMGGALYAHAAAAHLGNAVRGIVAVAGAVPLVSPAQFAAMSVRQRVVALTARYTPRMLPFVVRAGISQLDNKGERQFMEQLYQNSPADLRVASNPEVRDLIYAGYRFTVAQGHRAFEIDSFHVVRDWSATVAASDCPIALIHGTDDPAVSPRSVEAFHRGLADRATLDMLPDTGQLILYKDPTIVLDRLERIRDSG